MTNSGFSFSTRSSFLSAYNEAESKISSSYASRIRDSVKESQSLYVADTKSSAVFEEDDDSAGEDDLSVIDDAQIRFYNDFVEGKVDLSGDDALWEMQSTLNASLSKLFNRQPVFRGDESKWERPITHGLHNSAPIVPTQHNQAKSALHITSFHQIEAKSEFTDDLPSNDYHSSQAKNAPQNTLYNRIQANKVTFESTHKQVPSTTMLQNTNTANDEEEEEDGDDDEEYEYEADEQDDEAAFRNMGGMSADLMALLGIKADPSAQPAGPIDDWVPPTHAGLDNSDPLIAKQKMHYMQNGIVTADDDEDEEEED